MTFSLDIVEQKEEKKEKVEPPPYTKEEEEKYLAYKEIRSSYFKNKGVIKYWGKPKLKGMKTDIDLL